MDDGRVAAARVVEKAALHHGHVSRQRVGRARGEAVGSADAGGDDDAPMRGCAARRPASRRERPRRGDGGRAPWERLHGHLVASAGAPLRDQPLESGPAALDVGVHALATAKASARTPPPRAWLGIGSLGSVAPHLAARVPR